MPEFVTFFVTDKYNYSCAHCFYHRNLNSGKKDLGLHEIREISKGMEDFAVLDITGGEPFIRDDISDIAKIFYENNRIANVIIVTNGYFTSRIERHVREILRSCPGLNLLLDVSIDAIGADFDRIRGADSAYEKAVSTLQSVAPIRENNHNFKAGVILTYSALNRDSAIDTYSFLKKTGLFDSFKVTLVRGSSREAKVKDVPIDNYIKLSEIIERDLLNKSLGSGQKHISGYLLKAANILSYKTNIDTVNSGKWSFPCFACILNAVIYSDGRVHACELIDSPIGDLRTQGYNFRDIWRFPEAADFRKKVRMHKCFCTHECNTYTNILFNIKFYPRIFLCLMRFAYRIHDRQVRSY